MIRPLFVVLTGMVSGETCRSTGVRWFILIILLLFCLAGGYETAKFSGGAGRKRRLIFSCTVLYCTAFLTGSLLMDRAGAEDLHILSEGEEAGRLSGRIESLKEGKEGRLNLVLEKVRFVGGDFSCTLKKKVRVYISKDQNTLLPGDKVCFKGSLTLPEQAANPGQFDAESYNRAYGIYYLFYGERCLSIQRPSFSMERLAYFCKMAVYQVYRRFLSKDQAALLYAIVLGDKSLLSDEIKELYEANGVAHLLAVSGLHISIVGGRVYRLLRRCRLSYPVSCLGGGLVLLFYGCITGYGSSGVRAILMFLVYLGAELSGREYDLISSMSLSGILMLAEYPYRIREGGFLISYASILAIGVVIPVISAGYRRYLKQSRAGSKRSKKEQSRQALKEKFILSLLTGIAVTVSIMPVTMKVFYEISPYSVLLNLFMIPAMAPLMLSAVLGGIAGCFLPGTGQVLLWPAKGLLLLFERILKITQAFPGSVLITGCPDTRLLLLFYGCEAAALVLWYHKKHLPCLPVMLLGFCLLFYRPDGSLRIVMLDVGQGDGILLLLPNRQSILIDGGSTSEEELARYTLTPALKYYGIRFPDYLILSHLDADHYSGSLALMEEGFRPEGLLMQEWLLTHPDDAVLSRLQALTRDTDTRVSYVKRGDCLTISRVRLTFFHPYAGLDTQDKNDASLVFLLEYKQFEMLFTGDLGQEQEEAVLNALPDSVHPDVLKVGHHGSKNSTGALFLQRLKPAWAFISAGKDNRYGHPHRELLERLAACNAQVMRTDEGGAILAETNGEKLRVYYWKRQNSRNKN